MKNGEYRLDQYWHNRFAPPPTSHRLIFIPCGRLLPRFAYTFLYRWRVPQAHSSRQRGHPRDLNLIPFACSLLDSRVVSFLKKFSSRDQDAAVWQRVRSTAPARRNLKWMLANAPPRELTISYSLSSPSNSPPKSTSNPRPSPMLPTSKLLN